MEDITKSCQRIVDTFGSQRQIDQAIEEIAELLDAIMRIRNKGGNEDRLFHLAEELADVTIMLEQIRLIHEIHKCTVNDLVDYKLRRTMEKIQ